MIRTFKVIRDKDVTGVSGTGVILEGVRFSDGHVAIHWIGSKYPWTTPVPEGIEAVLDIHGHGGLTRLVWDDEQPAPEFNEDDIAVIHEALGIGPEFLNHVALRALRLKVRAMMTRKSIS